MVAFSEMFHAPFGFTVDELEGFKDFKLASGMLSATVNVAKSAQNYQILPNFAQRQLA
jgi:hypothetical protein